MGPVRSVDQKPTMTDFSTTTRRTTRPPPSPKRTEESKADLTSGLNSEETLLVAASTTPTGSGTRAAVSWQNRAQSELEHWQQPIAGPSLTFSSAETRPRNTIRSQTTSASPTRPYYGMRDRVLVVPANSSQVRLSHRFLCRGFLLVIRVAFHADHVEVDFQKQKHLHDVGQAYASPRGV